MKTGRYILGMFLAAVSAVCAGPYPPAADQPGTTALHMDTNLFVAWATGWTNYIVGAECSTQWQTPERALGKAGTDVTNIVCLGRGGSITMTFATPISDGPGFDFAVFENAFEPFASFLELGYVEVSSDGSNFFRFASDSLTTNPVGPFEVLDTTDVDGLAGKYRIGYGTPFDLTELAGVAPTLDVSRVGWVRIVDVVGDGGALDSDGDPIYDPYPTTGSAGFDLDAIGVINSPVTCALDLAPGGTLVTWTAHTNRLYQVEYTDDGGNTWTALGAPVTGDGTAHSLQDANPAAGMRIYRALESMAP